MHYVMLLIDENNNRLGNDKSKWRSKIQYHLGKYYSGNTFCDYASVGGRWSKLLSCKPKTGFWQELRQIGVNKPVVVVEVDPKTGKKITGSDFNWTPPKFKYYWNQSADKCDVCEIKDLTKPVDSVNFLSILLF